MSVTDCKHALRRLELDAYGSVVSALRAQGDLTSDKRRLLKDLQGSLRYTQVTYCFVCTHL
jgi:ENT domain